MAVIALTQEMGSLARDVAERVAHRNAVKLYRLD